MSMDLGALGVAFVDIRGRQDKLPKDVEDARNTVTTSLAKMGGAMTSIGTRLSAAITLPLTGAAAAAFKFGSDFETAFAGVTKTTDATKEQFDGLRNSFRQMSKEIPTSAAELAKIGEIGGQMNIPVDQIEEFTRVIAMMGTATDLSTERAATAFGNLSNIMKTPVADFERLGSTIVHLGNKSNATESQIVNMAERIAGAGAQIKLSEAEVLGWATALASVGIEAEAGGTAISRVFKDMSVAAATGGESLEQFAEVARMSAGQFQSLFQKDASAAAQAFVQGLERIGKEGGNVILTLEEMGIKEVRMSDALLRLSGNTKNLTDNLKNANDGWREGVALSKEAEQFYKTTANQLKIIANQLADVGIQLFDAFGPILKNTIIPGLRDFVGFLASLAKGFSELDPATQKVIIAFGAVAAAAGPVLVVLGTMASSITALTTLWAGFGTAVGGTAAATAPAAAATTGFGVGLTAVATSTIGFVGALGTLGIALGTTVRDYIALQNAETGVVEAENSRWQAVNKAIAQYKTLGTVIDTQGKSLEQLEKEVRKVGLAYGEQGRQAAALAESAERATRSHDAWVHTLKGLATMTPKLTEEQKKLVEAFQKSLKPADDLEKELGFLIARYGESDVVKNYSDSIIQAVEAQHKKGKSVSDLMGKLMMLSLQFKDTEKGTDALKFSTDKAAQGYENLAQKATAAGQATAQAAAAALGGNPMDPMGAQWRQAAGGGTGGAAAPFETAYEKFFREATGGGNLNVAGQPAIPANLNIGGLSPAISGQTLTDVQRAFAGWFPGAVPINVANTRPDLGLGMSPSQISSMARSGGGGPTSSIARFGATAAAAGRSATLASSGGGGIGNYQPVVNIQTYEGQSKEEILSIVTNAMATNDRGFLEKLSSGFRSGQKGVVSRRGGF